MTATPWGDVASLSELEPAGQPRPEQSPELAEWPPRQRLYAAMVAGCAERGFDSITIADLISLSGTSRETFYGLFENKQACFVATLEAILTGVFEVMAERYVSDDVDPEARARRALSGLVEMAAEQPAAARLCMIEPYAVGSVALEIVSAGIDRLRLLAERVLGQMPGREGFPAELTQAIIGGIYHVFFEALKEDVDLETLTEPLWNWAISYPAPPVPLRLRGRRPKLPPPGTIPPYAFVDPAERIIRGFASAVAQKGYRLTTIADIAARASISQRTLYEHFENKTEVLMAALDSSGMQLMAAVVPAIRRSPGWPESVRAATAATTRFLASEPDFARLRQVEVYAAGTAAIAARDATGLQLLQAATGDAEVADVHPVARQAILGAVFSIYYERITNHGTESLPELAPLLAFVILAPFIGAERASDVALGNPHRPRAALSTP